MTTYLIVPSEEMDAAAVNDLEERIDRLRMPNYLLPGPKVWLVRFVGSSKELSDKLGFRSDEGSLGVVFAIDPDKYSGFWRKSMWDWLDTHHKNVA